MSWRLAAPVYVRIFPVMRLMILMINTAVATWLLIISNLTPKSRIKYRSWATKTASIGAIVFLSSFDFGYDRVKNRKDKHIPYKEVLRMYYKNYVLPIYGECDTIIPKLHFSYERS